MYMTVIMKITGLSQLGSTQIFIISKFLIYNVYLKRNYDNITMITSHFCLKNNVLLTFPSVSHVHLYHYEYKLKQGNGYLKRKSEI